MSGMICLTCGRPVEPYPLGWVHPSAADAALCDWLKGLRDDDDPAVADQLEKLR